MHRPIARDFDTIPSILFEITNHELFVIDRIKRVGKSTSCLEYANQNIKIKEGKRPDASRISEIFHPIELTSDRGFSWRRAFFGVESEKLARLVTRILPEIIYMDWGDLSDLKIVLLQ